MCARSGGSACIAMVIMAPCTTPPTLADGRGRLLIARWATQALAPPKQESGTERAVFGVVFSRRRERSCVTPWYWIYRDSSSSRTTLSGIPLSTFFTRSRKQCSSGSLKVWNLTPPIEGRQCADRGSEIVDSWWDNHQFLRH